MSEQHEKPQAATPPSATPAGESSPKDVTRREGRRRLLKAGLASVPLVMTVRARPVWAQEVVNPMSHLGSPWYRGPWNARGDVLKDDLNPDQYWNTNNDDKVSGGSSSNLTKSEDDPSLNPDNILKFRDQKSRQAARDSVSDAEWEKHKNKPYGGSSENIGNWYSDDPADHGYLDRGD